ncbi:MAG: DNA double-strand break repair nuclease NurA [Anaerolineae bacterium]|nr:DNA double-strand break repair nuclease NurA [Anaerolineae bacterium]
MTLELHKLTGQVEQMGQALANQKEDIEGKMAIALQILEAYADEAYLPYILERVQDAVDKDAGYRGARPLDEPVMGTFPAGELPPSATIVAVDGSQILPDTHGAAVYYLLNIGTIIVHHGSGEPPQIISQPYLFYETEYVYTGDRGLITAATISARRTVAEMQALTEHGWRQRGEARPLLTLIDGPLLLFPMSAEIPDRVQLQGIYFSAMTRLLEVQAGLAGYVDRPSSRFVVSMLHLLDIPVEDVSRGSLSTNGRLEGLEDIRVYDKLLQPSERTALFIQMSPQNKEFRKNGGQTHEIVFFYMNVGASGEPPHLARVEIPMWVAQDKAMIATLQALIYHQCQQLMTRYPYILTRADELAVVKGEETRQLNVMIQVAMTRYGLATEQSAKQSGKNAARSPKTRFKVGGNI